MKHWSMGNMLTRFSKGPFNTEAFNTALVQSCLENITNTNIQSFIRGMLPHDHRIFFTHGDFRPHNIMVANGNVVAILGWRQSG